MTKIVEVAAAVLLRNVADADPRQEYLLAQRPVGKVYAGYWEFPGGKVEPGETLREALDRELREELGIAVQRAWPWLSRQFTYPHATVRLKFFRVDEWQGTIAPIEHSGFAWIKMGETPLVEPVLPANGPIMQALELPAVYAVTNAEENGVEIELARLKTALANGLRLVQVRDKTLSTAARQHLCVQSVALAHRYGAQVLVNDDVELARATGADGVHLSSVRLMQCRERPPFPCVSASCHDEAQLAQAATLALDFVVLGPTLPTPTHPDAKGIGWETFAHLVERAPLPVFSLGGMRPDMIETAWAHGAHGIALMRNWG